MSVEQDRINEDLARDRAETLQAMRDERVNDAKEYALTDEGALLEIVQEMAYNPQALIYIGRLIKEGKDGCAGASLVALFKYELEQYADRLTDDSE